VNFAPVDVGVVEATHLDNVEFVVLPSTFGVAAAHRDVVEKDIAGGMSARRRDGPIQQEARSGVGTPFHHQQCRTPRQHSTPRGGDVGTHCLRMVEPPRWGAVSSAVGTVIPEGTGLCQQGCGPVVLLAFGLRVDSTG